MTEDEATSWARVMVPVRFEGINSAALFLTAVRLGPSTATVRLGDADGSEYRVELELADGLVALAEVERTYPD
jgi:hypothetical protein